MRLELFEVSAGYGKKTVLENLSLEVTEGSICALLGPNGSGKTTLLRNIGGLLKPQRGKILLSGNNIHDMSRKQIALNMAFVPQSANIPFNYTGLDMVVMGKTPHISVWSSPGPKAREEARVVMHNMGITYLLDQYYMQMSAGEKQLILLARAVMQEAPLLLLDEPTSHLDLRNQLVIMEMVTDIARLKETTVLITLHDPNLALRYCDHSALLSGGRLLAQGPTERVLTGENLSEVYGVEVKCEITEGGRKVVVPTGNPHRRLELVKKC